MLVLSDVVIVSRVYVVEARGPAVGQKQEVDIITFSLSLYQFYNDVSERNRNVVQIHFYRCRSERSKAALSDSLFEFCC